MKRERRRHIRVPGPFAAVLKVGARNTPVRVLNLSEGGCYVDGASDHPPLGGSVVLELTLPNGPSILLTGEVVFAHPGSGFGVLFAPTEAAHGRFEQALAHLRQQAP